MSFFTDEYIYGLNEEPLIAAQEMAAMLHERRKVVPEDMLRDGHSFLYEFIKQNELAGIDCPLPRVGVDSNEFAHFLVNLRRKVELLYEKANLQSSSRRVAELLAKRKGFSIEYEFAAEDYGNLQDLISELREAIVREPNLSEGHRQRMLSRIESLQKELHRKVSSMDHLLGIVYDAAVAARKIGKEGVKLAAIGKAIYLILVSTTAKSEGLELGTLLGMPGIDLLPEKKEVDVSDP